MKNSSNRLVLMLTLLSIVVFTYFGYAFAAFVCIALFGFLTYKLTHTPHGHLDYRTAVSLHLLTFGYRLKPDPDINFYLHLPINLLYPLSSLLPNEPVEKTQDIMLDGGDGSIPARVYWPNKTSERIGSMPVIVYFHGGGFVVGSVNIFDDVARSLSNSTRAIVVSVEYRLAPRHPFPAAIEDGYAAVNWVTENARNIGADPKKLLIAGDSAGAAICAVLALKALEENGPNIIGQILYYPVTDLRGTPYGSVQNFSDGYGLSKKQMDGFFDAYIGHLDDPKDLEHPYISPLLAPKHSGLPPALIVTAGFDPLHNSGDLYAQKLKENNVPVTYIDYKNMVHGFMSIRFFSQRRDAFNETGKFVDRILMRN